MEKVLDDVINLIQNATGYSVNDVTLIEYLLNSEKQKIFNFCNISEVPESLYYALVEMTASAYMQIKRADILGSDNLEVVTSIREGDTQISFGGSNAESRLLELISYFGRERDLLSYRKLKW